MALKHFQECKDLAPIPSIHAFLGEVLFFVNVENVTDLKLMEMTVYLPRVKMAFLISGFSKELRSSVLNISVLLKCVFRILQEKPGPGHSESVLTIRQTFRTLAEL